MPILPLIFERNFHQQINANRVLSEPAKCCNTQLALTKFKLYWSSKMAEIKVTHPDVESAEKVLWGYMAEAQCLAQLMEQSNDESPFVTLSASIINRLTDAVDQYHTELLRHGVASLDDRSSLEPEA